MIQGALYCSMPVVCYWMYCSMPVVCYWMYCSIPVVCPLTAEHSVGVVANSRHAGAELEEHGAPHILGTLPVGSPLIQGGAVEGGLGARLHARHPRHPAHRPVHLPHPEMNIFIKRRISPLRGWVGVILCGDDDTIRGFFRRINSSGWI